MSAQIKDGGAVDVLAEMQADIDALEQRVLAGEFTLSRGYNKVNRLRSIHAAVAELIERARALRSAHCAFQDWKAKAPKRYPAPRSILEMNAHAKAMLFAALDRVGGAK